MTPLRLNSPALTTRLPSRTYLPARTAAPMAAERAAGTPANAPASPLRKQAEQLEGLFLNTLVSQMLSSTNSRGMFGGGYAEETWKSMQAEQISNQIAQSGGIGLADTIMQNLLTLQSAKTAATGAKSQ